MDDTAALAPDTAIEDEEALPAPELPETVQSEVPETEEAESPETEPAPLTPDDPRVAALIKAETAKLNESYRRREENARRQAALEEYERAREEAYNRRAQSAVGELSQMLKDAFEEGKEPDQKKVEELILGTSAAGLIETLESMESWVNSFLKEDNPTFYRQVAEEEELNRLWSDAKVSRRPDRLFSAALKVAAASGEAKGYSKGQQAVLNAMKAREAEQKKTQQIRQAADVRSKEGVPAVGLSGRTPSRLSLQQIEEMPMSEWQSIPKEERTRLLEEVRRAANR